MADTKTTGLTEITSAADDDVLAIVDVAPSPTTKKIKVSNFAQGGTYTPTLSNTTNVASSTASVCHYMRVGSVVTVSGAVTIDVTAATATLLGMSLPIASNFSASTQLGGVASTYDGVAVNEVAEIIGDSTNDRASIRFYAVATTARTWRFTFTYVIA